MNVLKNFVPSKQSDIKDANTTQDTVRGTALIIHRERVQAPMYHSEKE
jgi:hypothetical protein